MKFAIFWVICLHLCDSINSFNLSSRKWKWKHHNADLQQLAPLLQPEWKLSGCSGGQTQPPVFLCDVPKLSYNSWETTVGNLPSLMGSFHCLLQAPCGEKMMTLKIRTSSTLSAAPLFMSSCLPFLQMKSSSQLHRHSWLLWHSVVACLHSLVHVFISLV